MTTWRIAWQYLWSRKLTTGMTILSVALGVGLITAVLTLYDETRKRFEEEGQFFDIVVGAKGSPLQLTLSSVYFMDTPTGNILYSDYELLRDHEDVAHAFPIGLGDTYAGHRIVGTSREFFDAMGDLHTGQARPPFELAEGRYFENELEAVVGALAARQTGLGIGDTFVGTHGFMEMPRDFAHLHDDHPYTVVGVLEPTGTPNDRAIFCALEDIWRIHDEESHNGHDHGHGHDHSHGHGAPNPEEAAAGADPAGDGFDLTAEQVTSVLVILESPALRFQFRQWINENLNAMAAIPVNEIRDLYDRFLGTAQAVLLRVGYLVVVVSAISILIGLYLSILQRRRDLAIMRALGASAPEIVGSILIEALIVTLLGIGAGWVLGNAVAWIVGLQLVHQYGLYIESFGAPVSEAFTAYALVALAGLVAGILPAYQAYRADVARDLAEL